MIQSFNTFNQLLEFNKYDINLLNSPEINNRFTIAFEFEMACKDKNAMKFLTGPDLDTFKQQLYSTIKIDPQYTKFIDDIFNKIDLTDEEYTLEKLLVSKYKDEKKNEIVDTLYQIFEEFFESEIDDESIKNKDLEYAISKVQEHLPNFYQKYQKQMSFVFDLAMKEVGIEMVPSLFIIGISEAVEMLNLFYAEFDKQNYWFQDIESTSLHMNIGMLKRSINDSEKQKIYDMKTKKALDYLEKDFVKAEEYNLVKGLLMLKDYGDKTSFVHKDIDPKRVGMHFSQSIVQMLLQKSPMLSKKIEDVFEIDQVENLLNSEFHKLMKKEGPKAFGFNFDYLKDKKYVEYRYLGGILNVDTCIEKLLYFCYISYLMIDQEYKRKEYLKRLYKFVQEIKNH